MKEMQDNNLFGSDSTPSSPTPMIKEISLRDITQAVDLAELRRQNYENRNTCIDFMMPTRSTNELDVLPFNRGVSRGDDNNSVDSKNDVDFKKNEAGVSENQNLLDELPTDLSTDALITEAVHQPVVDDICERNTEPIMCSQVKDDTLIEMPCDSHTYDIPLFDHLPNNISRSEGSEHVYSTPSHVPHPHYASNDPNAPNGDVKPKRKGIKFMLEAEPPGSNFVLLGDNNNQSDTSKWANLRGTRRLSIPDSKPKESRTFHPRKRQTIHGNRRDKGRGRGDLDVDKFSKEELLLMWKSSEVDLNEKLKAAQIDKQRLQTKLKAMKLNKSTAV